MTACTLGITVIPSFMYSLANMAILHWNYRCNSVPQHDGTTSLKNLNALTNLPQDEGRLSSFKPSTFCRSFLLSLPTKLLPWYPTFFTLHALSQSLLWCHIASSALYILFTRLGNSGDKRRHITGVSLFSLWDSTKSQSKSIKLAMVRWLPLLLRSSCIVSHNA